MMTAEENETLTRIGPGSRMGKLLRRYWQAIAPLAEMDKKWTKRVRIMGEDLVLYKDRSGRFGLIGEYCPHRRASLAYGMPTDDGIRCMYHGWEFNQKGECIDQPNESRHALKGKNVSPAYPVQEMGGLLFGYLGPLPAPILPRFDGYVADNAIRTIGHQVIPCNWLQCMENSVDPIHTQWLHGAYMEWVNRTESLKTAHHRTQKKIAFDEFEFGIIKRRLHEGQSEDSDDWKVGHPLLFPNGLAVGSAGGHWTNYTFQLRVPIDDTHTQHFWYNAYVPPAGSQVPDRLLNQAAVYEAPIKDADGNFLTQYIHAQDIMAWVTQGEIADRTQENLGASDIGIVTYRKMLMRELEKVERGEDPIGTIRDPAKDVMIDLPMEKNKSMFDDGFEFHLTKHNTNFSPIKDDLIRIMVASRGDKTKPALEPAE